MEIYAPLEDETGSKRRSTLIGDSLFSGAKSIRHFIRSTKSWMLPENKDEVSIQLPPQEEFVSHQNQLFNRVQTHVPTVAAEELSLMAGRSRNVHRVLAIHAPWGIDEGEEFTVALPTGENRSVTLPMEVINEQLLICYDLMEEETIRPMRVEMSKEEK